MGRRDEEKKRRRKKRLADRERQRGSRAGLSPELDHAIRGLQQLMNVPEPATWPGGADPALARPDKVKFSMAMNATEREPGKSKLREMTARLRGGLLGALPELDHWAMEAFLWRGVPGDDWHPIEAFLAQEGPRFPPAAADQLRLWKQAELGLFEVGPVAGDLVSLHEWDGRRRTGLTRRAISLGIGGVNAFRDASGEVLLTYLAPWRPEAGIYCAMGYGPMAPRRTAGLLLPYLRLRYLEAAMRPLPWKLGPQAAREYLRAWRERDWEAWFRRVLTIPFDAAVPVPPDGLPALHRIEELLPSYQGDSQTFGVYFHSTGGPDEGLMAGGTGVNPLDLSGPNALALAEYQAYREIDGPPPGTAGMPAFVTL